MMGPERFSARDPVQLAKPYLHDGSVVFAAYWRMLLGIDVFMLRRCSIIAALQEHI